MDKELKKEVKEFLCDMYSDSLFCEGISQIIYEGINFKGLNEMTDEELIKEYETVVDDESDELLQKIKMSITVDKLV